MLLSLWAMMVLLCCKGCLCAYVEITPTDIVALPKQNVTFICKVGVSIQYCRIEIPGLHPFNLKPNLPPTNGVVYYGAGLKEGQCGATIDSVKENNNGVVKCSMGTETEARESIATARLTVAKAPKAPELDLSRGTDSLKVYRVGDVLQASCIVRDGRPAANISWFLDDEQIFEDLGLVTIVDNIKDELHSTVQNLTRTLRATDNGKKLRCVARHPSLSTHNNEVSRQLDIKYAPLGQETSIDKFGYELGKPGIISVEISANPRPILEWVVRDEHIREGNVDSTGRLEAEAARDEGRGRYIATLRIASINKDDTETPFKLTAYNDQGSREYYVVISTSPEPAGLDLGIGYIVGIVIALLLLLMVVFLIVFARATGRWCFSARGTTSRHAGETSDTESTAEVRQREPKLKTPKIQFSSVFKRNKDKVGHEEETARPMGYDELKTTTEESQKQQEPDRPEGIVYAELDLVAQNLRPLVKNDDDKTEYAEIIYTQNPEGEPAKQAEEPKTS